MHRAPSASGWLAQYVQALQVVIQTEAVAASNLREFRLRCKRRRTEENETTKAWDPRGFPNVTLFVLQSQIHTRFVRFGRFKLKFMKYALLLKTVKISDCWQWTQPLDYEELVPNCDLLPFANWDGCNSSQWIHLKFVSSCWRSTKSLLPAAINSACQHVPLCFLTHCSAALVWFSFS